jgi:hypothetical protein
MNLKNIEVIITNVIGLEQLEQPELGFILLRTTGTGEPRYKL